jgi:tetratricopeptide (TPR) repeat protein
MKRKKTRVFVFLSILYLLVFNAYAQKILIPEFYGIYLVANGKLIELNKNHVNYAYAQGDCWFRGYITGLKNLSPINITDNQLYIILFLENLDLSAIKLSKLQFVDKYPLECQVLGVGLESQKKMTLVNMWVIEKNIPYRIAPVEGKTGMYRIVPKEPLEAGKYAINTGCFWNSTLSSSYDLSMVLAEKGTEAFDFSLDLLIEEKLIKLIEEGHKLFNENKLDEALVKYKTALQMKPGWSEPYALIGFVYKDKKDYTNAIENFRKFLKLEPYSERSAEVKGGLAEVEKELTEMEKEQKKIQEAKKKEEFLSHFTGEQIKLNLLEKLDKARYYLTAAYDCSFTRPVDMVIEKLLISRKELEGSLVFADDEMTKTIEGYIYQVDNIEEILRASKDPAILIKKQNLIKNVRDEVKSLVKKLKSNK